jgi:glutamate-1-semialdehyde 2,1-aminomutase/spore coat polysaccharide biosynthesis protein SpsF
MITARRILSSWRRPEPAPLVVAARYLDHNVPPVAVAGATSVVRVRVENAGPTTWHRDAQAGCHVALAAFLDGQVVGSGRFLADTVGPAGTATIAVPLTWPDATGEHRLTLDLFVPDRVFFSNAGTPALEVAVSLRRAEATPTEALRGALRHNEWFYSPGQGVYRTRDGQPAYPLFGKSARGCTITDVDGREYVDLHMGWGCNLLGYADERVQDAVARALASGGIGSLVHRGEMEVSEALCDWFGLGDEVLFGKNGSDVTTWAVRTARVATGRKTVLYAGYHGWQDWNAAALGFEATGIPGPPGPAHRFRYADLPALEAAAAQHADDLAAVMIEPAATAHDHADPDHEGNRTYLLGAEALARRYGALFVLDEIFTGFRFRQRFAQTYFGVRPDLTCLGKALANGLALSALVGRGGVLRRCIGRIHYSPSNKGEAYAFAGALAALSVHRGTDVPSEVWAAGNALRTGVHALCAERGLPARLVGAPYRMYMSHFAGSLEQRVHARTILQQELARHGVVSHRGYVIVSRRHDRAAVERCLSAYAAALDAIRDAVEGGGALRMLDIPDVPEEGPS